MFKILEKKYFDVWIFYVFGNSEVLHLSKKSYDGVFRDIYRNGKILKKKFEGAIKKGDNTFFDFSTLKFLAKSTSKLDIDVFELDNGSFKEYSLYNQVSHLNEDGNGLFYQVSEDYKVTNGYTNISNPNMEYVFEDKTIIFSTHNYPNAYYLTFAEDEKRVIHCFSVSQKKITWHFSLATLKDLYPEIDANWEVWHFVGVVEGVLWVDLSSSVLPNGYVMGGLLGLDAQTGDVKHFLYEPTQMNEATEDNFWFLSRYGHTVYDAEKKCLVGLVYKNYYAVDLKMSAPELKMWSVETEFNKYDVALANADNRTMDKDHIYFIGTNHSGNIRSKIGALNRQTLELDWVYDFGADFPALLGRIEVTETHLFVLDSSGTLHIFEREE